VPTVKSNSKVKTWQKKEKKKKHHENTRQRQATQFQSQLLYCLELSLITVFSRPQYSHLKNEGFRLS